MQTNKSSGTLCKNEGERRKFHCLQNVSASTRKRTATFLIESNKLVYYIDDELDLCREKSELKFISLLSFEHIFSITYSKRVFSVFLHCIAAFVAF